MSPFTQAGLGETRSEITLEEEQLPKQTRKTGVECQNDLPDVMWQVSDRAGTATVTNHGPVWSYSGRMGEEKQYWFLRGTVCMAVSRIKWKIHLIYPFLYTNLKENLDTFNFMTWKLFKSSFLP